MYTRLDRFWIAQGQTYVGYERALREIKNGKKESHWIWYIFPQLKGLGYSAASDYYGINGLEEAKAYLDDRFFLLDYVKLLQRC